ncbi:NAD-dependent succinate-semialdehyde dehydrogenase [Rhizorhabdus wittichii]|jgi:succinate-semialdehyde dehydrogenase/glutarate-semialdehyde dehydrogenase|uniref:NAD-dependent succinate-semialdehyde dehydrogenase n=1 Tax=Rhizorhabdus wittichii TaxID=160791 RepID=UPI0002F3418B|nr:NAD-dependent succinate-semialdehyde dehydrogenase [Rhizorhabdus wittichii]
MSGATMLDRDARPADHAAFLGGSWEQADDGRTMAVIDPADGSTVGTVPYMGAAETRRAVEAAHAAFPGWSARSGRDRARIMRRMFDLIIDRQDELALLLTREQGKPLGQARGEVVYGASYLEWYAEEAPRIRGDIMSGAHDDKTITILRQPIGTTAAITPWNFPFVSVTRKLAPALAAGCTQILKPAPTTPLVALALAGIAQEAGLPDGVFNVLTGDDAAIGGALTESRDIRLLSFTGSTAIGKLLYRQCADTVKKLSLELGGHAPFIVFDDADIDAAVEGLIACKLRNMGQVCIAANRIFVHDRVYDRFADQLVVRVDAMTMGPGVDDLDQGPLANRAVFDKVARHVVDAVEGGAHVLAGGGPDARGGLFFRPTVLADVADNALLNCEETFGPVIALSRFSDEDEVIARANDTPFGLAGYFYSRDHGRVMRVAGALECGIIGANIGVVASAAGPFGGIKESGLGREGALSGLEEFLEQKYLCSPRRL